MENTKFSKASALFNFLLDNFDPNKKLGDLNFRDIVEIIKFLDGESNEKGSESK